MIEKQNGVHHDRRNTLKNKLRSVLADKKDKRTSYHMSDNDFSNWVSTEQKVLGFRKQEEFGLKKRIKP